MVYHIAVSKIFCLLEMISLIPRRAKEGAVSLLACDRERFRKLGRAAVTCLMFVFSRTSKLQAPQRWKDVWSP
jgi:hypothetical protein